MIKEDLKDYIKKLYGSQKACADALGVDRRTVYRWINENPKRMIKYVDAIVKTSDTTKIQIIGEILYHDEEING